MTESIAKEIGKEVKKARKENGLTQQDLSQKVSISRSYIADIEGGRYIPSVEILISLSKELKIDMNLFKNDGNTRRG
ncbi:helix-turn-helix transcriptional regulator [Clostridium sp. NSJ-49]|uniref:helix-turn-helix transcriptional regulator n=1 Tax=Clostridium sp. NSJ-49 TaxID=2763034 RepID=UPI001A9B8385|nr:helix-turn-helix transcriptional regulator [Clostridium sp. NSJ-49]MDU6340735.1 helix-turn-helix transcriptional regulator [Clostridium sp.]